MQFLAGAGTQTAALAFGGQVPILVHQYYDGSSWTAVGIHEHSKN